MPKPLHSTYYQKRRADRQAEGRCYKCPDGIINTARSKWLCDICADKNMVCRTRWWETHRDWAVNRQRTRAALSAARLRKEVFDAYGNKCACCGETELMFLQIDHIKEDGAEHRREIVNLQSGAGVCTYQWLRKNGYPKDNFQILCANCNWGKYRSGGVCPHQLTEEQRQQSKEVLLRSRRGTYGDREEVSAKLKRRREISDLRAAGKEVVFLPRGPKPGNLKSVKLAMT